MPLHQNLIGFGVQAGVFDPLKIAGLSLWLDASKISGLADNDPVTIWPDLSANAYHPVQATGTNQPAFKTAIINGLPVVRFDGVDNYLENTANNPVAGGGARTVFMVGDLSSTTGAWLTFRRTTTIFACQFSVSGGNSIIYSDGVSGTNNATITNPGATLNSTFQVMLRSAGSGNKITCRVNRVDATVSQTGSASSESGSNGFSVGRRADAGVYLNGDVGEIIVYNTALSSADRDRVELYLRNKWATP